MGAKYLAATAVIVILLCGTPALADSTLQIGTACRAGWAGSPDPIDRGDIFDIARVLGVQPREIADPLAVLAVSTDSRRLSVTLKDISTISEPGALVLLGAGLLSLGGILHRWAFSA
jgi:hypothetical protein